MKFQHLLTDSYGALGRRELDLDAPIVVVEGPNESGKSTFRSALETVLYGFEPSRRAQHPLAKGSTSDLRIVAELELGDRVQRVERVLQDRGRLRLAEGDAEFEGARKSNRPLPFAADVPLPLYRSVYALSTDDLTALDERAREHAGELLLGEKALPELLPIHEVRAALAQDAARLWRSDRRGKARSREVTAALENARAARARAREEEDELRSVRIERKKLLRQLEGLREQREELERERDEAAYLRELSELARRRAAMGPLDLEPLEGVALVSPTELRSEVDALERRLVEPLRRQAREPRRVGERALRLIGQAPRIDAALREESRHGAECEALEAAREDLSTGTLALEREWTAIRGEAVDAEGLETLATAPLEALRAAHRTWSEAWEAARATPRGRALEPWLYVTAAIGTGVSLTSHLGDALDARWGALGTTLVLGSLVAALRGTQARVPEPEAEHDAMLDLLDSVGIDAGAEASPLGVQTFLDALGRARAALERVEHTRRGVERLEAAVEARERAWRRLGSDLDLPFGPDEDAAAMIEVLADELALAKLAEREAAEDAAERESTAELVQELEERRARVADHLGRVREVLDRSLPEEPDEERAWRELLDRREEHSYLRARARELESDVRYPRLCEDPRLTPTAGERAVWHPRAVEEREDALREISRTIEAKSRREGEIQSELARDPGSRVARAQEKVEALEAELQEILRQRDRLALLDRVLGEAERRFRERHQPDVLRRASEHLAQVTGGRYVRLDALEEGGRLEVWPADGGDPVAAAAPLSRGTLDQIFLCLRLGLLDHLDEGRSPLPWVLDEVLVHWDEDRRRALYPLLERASRQRQVFLLTCHSNLAREAVEALGARSIQLTTSVPATAR